MEGDWLHFLSITLKADESDFAYWCKGERHLMHVTTTAAAVNVPQR